MNDYGSNSYKSREAKREAAKAQPKNVQKVISGSVTTKKKTGVEKFASSMFAEDLHKAGDYVKNEVLWPSLKKAISDIIKNGIDILLYGETRSSKSSNIPASKISYQNYYSNQNNSSVRPVTSRSTYEYDSLVFNDRGEAQIVLDTMDALIEEYGNASVGDLYDSVGLTGSPTDFSYGWTDLHEATIIRTNAGYQLKLPRVSSIK